MALEGVIESFELNDDETLERPVWLCPTVSIGRAVAAWVREHGFSVDCVDEAIVASGGPNPRAAQVFEERSGITVIKGAWQRRR